MVKTFHELDIKLLTLSSTIVIESDKISIRDSDIGIFDNLQKTINSIVYTKNIEIFGKYVSLKSLEERYCNCYKNSGYLKVFNDDLVDGTIVSGDIQVLGIWINNKSFGAYCKLVNHQIIKNEYQFTNSDSDSEEIETIINSF